MAPKCWGTRGENRSCLKRRISASFRSEEARGHPSGQNAWAKTMSYSACDFDSDRHSGSALTLIRRSQSTRLSRTVRQTVVIHMFGSMRPSPFGRPLRTRLARSLRPQGSWQAPSQPRVNQSRHPLRITHEFRHQHLRCPYRAGVAVRHVGAARGTRAAPKRANQY